MRLLHTQRKPLLMYSAIIVALVLAALVTMITSHGKISSYISPAKTKGAAAAVNSVAPTFDKKQYSIDNPTSPWVIVNKHRPLNPIDYAPQLATPSVPLRLAASNPEMQVSSQIVNSLQQLFAGAQRDGLTLMVASGYRSYQAQVSVYGAEVSHNGQAGADRESARPGFSEHQTGLAADIEPASRTCEVEACFGDLAEGKWLAANAYRYGFIIRYQQGSESVTGYTYEPWHIRYVGSELSNELHSKGNPLLENFFDIGAAANYQ